MARLRGFVYVKDEHGAMRRYGPDDEVPSSVAKTITNPAAWQDAGTSSSGGDEAPAAPPEQKPATKRQPRRAKPREGSTQDVPQAEPDTAREA